MRCGTKEFIGLVLFASLGCTADQPPPNKQDLNENFRDLGKVVEDCRGLRYVEFCDIVNGFAARKDLSALIAIAKSDLGFRAVAAKAAVEVMDAEKAVFFCSQLEIDSPEWHGAFGALDHHPKNRVIGYVRQVAQSPIPEVRRMCYEVCRSNRWNDLVEEATNDLSCDVVPFFLNKTSDEAEETLGHIAMRYLQSLQRK